MKNPIANLVMAVAALLAADAVAQPQPAQQRFVVPLDLKQLHPSITLARVVCDVAAAVPTLVPIASGETRVAISNQAFKGDVVVLAKYVGMTPADARQWQCRVDVDLGGAWKTLGAGPGSTTTNAAGAPNGIAPAIVSGTFTP